MNAFEIQNPEGDLKEQLDKYNEKLEKLYDPNKIISLRNVHKTYLLGVEGVTALRGVSIDIKEGEFVIILGTSGGGKTSLLNIMGTIDKPTKGDVYICGQKIKNTTQDKYMASLRLVRLGFVFQTFNLISSLTALENVELPMILRGELGRDKIRQRAIELLEKVGLKERMNHFPNQLSGGEQQRVTISRALANEPKILFLDEPTGDLDTKNSDMIMKLLIDLNKNNNITMIMVTHDVGLKSYADRVVKMVDGKVSAIEEIDPKQKMESISTLDKIMSGELKPEEAEFILGVRSGMVQNLQKAANITELTQEQKDRVNAKTERRKPTDYAVLNYAKNRILKY